MCPEKGDVCGETEGFWDLHRSTRPTGSLAIFIIKLTLYSQCVHLLWEILEPLRCPKEAGLDEV